MIFFDLKKMRFGSYFSFYLFLLKNYKIFYFNSEIKGRTLLRVTVGGNCGENQSSTLFDTVYNWVTSNIENSPNKYMKIQFFLFPHSSNFHHIIRQEKLKKVNTVTLNDLVFEHRNNFLIINN